MPAAKHILDKIGDKFTVGDGCWIWTGAISDGYGTTSRMVGPKGKRVSQTVYAHRVLYELLVGRIPDGLHLDHLCHTNDPACEGRECIHRRCVRPDHLEAVTQAENNRRAPGNGYREKTHCKQGHLFDEANTYCPPTGGRQCRECSRIAHRKRYVALRSRQEM